MRTSQELLINFASFPKYVIDFIEKCLTEDKTRQSKYELQFVISENLGSVASQLDVIQNTEFKTLRILSLKLLAATESAVRQYLVSCFRTIKEENRRLQNKLAGAEQDLRDKLSAYNHNVSDKDQELELLRNDFKSQLTMKDDKHALALQEEKNRLINKQKEETNRIEKEWREKEYRFRKQIQQLEAELSRLDALNKELKDKKYQHESTIKQLRSTVHILEDTKKGLDETIENLQKKYDNLHSEITEKKSNIDYLNKKISDNEQSLRNKSERIGRLQEQIYTEVKQTKSYKIELDNVNLQLEMSEKTRKMLEEEKMVLNKIILKLQEKVKEAKEGCVLSTKYKERIEENEKLLMDAKKETVELNMNLQVKNAEVFSLTNSVECLNKKIEELENTLKNKDLVVRWLNRQLTESGIVPHYESPVNLVPSPSTVAQKALANINYSLRRSPGSDSSPLAFTTANNAAKRPVSSTPSQFNRMNATDSAYCTISSNQASPQDLQNSPNRRFEDIKNCEIDPSALSAAFGDQNQPVKHSTAEKNN